MAVIKTEHYEFDMSTLDKIKRWQFDALDDLLHGLERDLSTWSKLLEKGKPYYAAIDYCVSEDDFKNILDVVFERIGYDKADRLLYKFERGKHRRIAEITLKEEGEEAIYEVYYVRPDFTGKIVYISGFNKNDVRDKFYKLKGTKKYPIWSIELVKSKEF